MKISQSQREKIARRAAEFALKKTVDANRKLEIKLAEKCYNHVFPKKIRDALVGVPDGWLRKDKCLKFNVGGWSITLCSDKDFVTPASDHCKPLGSIEAGELCTQVQELSVSIKTTRLEALEKYNKMLGFLSSFNTFKQLREKWADGKQFYEDMDVDNPKASLPAVVIDDINAMIGL